MLTKSGKAIALDQENCMKIDVKLSSSQNITSKKLEKSVKQLSASQGMHSIKTDRTRLKVSASQ